MRGSPEPGTPSVEMLIQSFNCVYYFDSCRAPPNPLISQYLTKFPRITQNRKSFQSLLPKNCGYYVIFIILMCSLGYTMPQIETFLSKQRCQDFFAVDYVNKYL